jgi:hypothetical protein
MTADIYQTVAVVMIVMAAIGYLLVAWRRGHSCGKGGSCCDALTERNTEPDDTLAPTSAKQPFIFSEDLADRAKKCARALPDSQKDDTNSDRS